MHGTVGSTLTKGMMISSRSRHTVDLINYKTEPVASHKELLRLFLIYFTVSKELYLQMRFFWNAMGRQLLLPTQAYKFCQKINKNYCFQLIYT